MLLKALHKDCFWCQDGGFNPMGGSQFAEVGDFYRMKVRMCSLTGEWDPKHTCPAGGRPHPSGGGSGEWLSFRVCSHPSTQTPSHTYAHFWRTYVNTLEKYRPSHAQPSTQSI